MNVDSTRATDSSANDSASSRSAAKSSGFPALMASILGGGSAEAKSPSERTDATRERPAGDAVADHAAQGGQGGMAERAARAPQARDAQETRAARDAREAREARGARDVRDARSDRAADRKRAAEDGDGDADAADSAPDCAAADAAPRTDASEDEDAPVQTSAAEEGDPSQVVPTAEPAVWEVAAALAVPELVARLSGLGAETGEAAEREPLDDGALGDGESVEASAAGSAEEAGLGEAAMPNAPLMDAGGREAAIEVVEAAKQGAAAADADPASEGAPAAVVAAAAEVASESPRIESEREVEATPRFESRPAAALEAARRDALEGSTIAPNEVGLRVGAGNGAESGSGDASQEQPKPASTRGAEGAEAGAALGAAAAAVTSGAGEAVARSAESSAASGPDALAATTPAAPASEADATLPPDRVQAGRAAEAITVQADWLASRGGGTARLVLNPPELGELVIRVSVRQQNVDVVMVAQTALGHSMAQDQSDRLAQAFAHRDLRLDQFEVRRADPSDANAGAGQFGSSDAGQRERERADDREMGFDFAAGRGGRRRSIGGAEGPMAPTRPTAGGRAAGIDLRI